MIGTRKFTDFTEDEKKYLGEAYNRYMQLKQKNKYLPLFLLATFFAGSYWNLWWLVSAALLWIVASNAGEQSYCREIITKHMGLTESDFDEFVDP